MPRLGVFYIEGALITCLKIAGWTQWFLGLPSIKMYDAPFFGGGGKAFPKVQKPSLRAGVTFC